MIYTIDNGKLCVSVDSYGAQITSVKLHGQQRAWQNENGAWKDTAPLLFPVCGHFDVTISGKSYPMPAHGFAKKMPFALTESTADKLLFTCHSSAETKKMYPFDFCFSVEYALQDTTLKITYIVENMGNQPLPFACGGHDSFALKTDVGAYQVVFDKPETLVHYAHDDDGYLTGESVCYGENMTVFPLPSEYLSEGRTLIFGGIASRKVTLQTKEGRALAKLSFDGFDHLLLWRATADSKYICIEPWTNLPDLDNAPATEFTEKAGVYSVPVGEKQVLVREIEYF